MTARFRTCLPASETLARIGGDEFAVLVESVDGRLTPAEIADRILATVREPFVVSGEPVRVGVSVGIALYPEDGRDVRTVLKAADQAMYRAKVAGGNMVKFSATSS